MENILSTQVYRVLHPVGQMNHECVFNNDIRYQQVAEVHASSLDNAFMGAQNDFSASYRSNSVRSTSVGDIIITTDEKYFMVMGRGFKEMAACLACGKYWECECTEADFADPDDSHCE